MRATQKAAIVSAAKKTSQFELTTKTITKLNTFKLTPTAKLVLLYLTTCYNPKHKEVFPKQKTIADRLGISERSVTRAIQELFKEGLVLIECKYTNRYKFTSKIAQNCPANLSDDLGQNDILKDDKLSHPYTEQIKEQNKEQTSKSGENVYMASEQSARAERRHVYCERSLNGDDLILYEYAKKKAKYNVDALIKKIKENGGDKKIISEYKKRQRVTQRALNNYKESQAIIKLYESYAENAVTAESCGCSLKDILKKKKEEKSSISV